MKNKAVETANYIIEYSETNEKWTLNRKVGQKRMFLNECSMIVPLIVTARRLEERMGGLMMNFSDATMGASLLDGIKPFNRCCPARWIAHGKTIKLDALR